MMLLTVPLCNSTGVSNISSYPLTVIKAEKKIKGKNLNATAGIQKAEVINRFWTKNIKCVL